MGKIIVIGLGPGDIGSLTLEAAEKIKTGNKVFLRTEKHPTVSYLKNNNINYSAYDYVYEKEKSFDDVYELITQDLVKKAQEYDIINYCVPGHPLVGDRTVSMLMNLEKNGKIDVEIVTGMSLIDPLVSILGRDILDGCKIVDGLDLANQLIDLNSDNIITQVYNKIIATEIKLQLTDIYGDDYTVYLINSAGTKAKEKVEKISLYELDRMDSFNYMTTLYIPKMTKDNRVNYNMYNLMKIMERLRSKNGCPWDIEQTHKSLREFVLEEAYEVVDAIDSEDVEYLVEELGDLLLQVVFHCEIAKEEGDFTIWDVISGVCNKLIYRHPHVFSEVKAKDIKDANENWNAMKDKEKNIKNYTQRLKDIPKGLSALSKSFKVQKKAAEVGFDWEEIQGAYLKMKEELLELRNAYEKDDVDNLEEELGDVLFAIVNLSRFLNINPEVALNRTINKFIKRFEFMEQESGKRGKDLKTMNLEEMESLWSLAKIHKSS